MTIKSIHHMQQAGNPSQTKMDRKLIRYIGRKNTEDIWTMNKEKEREDGRFWNKTPQTKKNKVTIYVHYFGIHHQRIYKILKDIFLEMQCSHPSQFQHPNHPQNIRKLWSPCTSLNPSQMSILNNLRKNWKTISN